MSSLASAPSVSGIGRQRPRISSVPDYVSSAGKEAVELAAMAGLDLDPWQAYVLEHSLGERADGQWAAREVGLVVPRQNGKGSILEARELAGLFLLGERFLIHSAHEFATSLEAFRRLRALIEDNDEFRRRVKRFSNSHGDEGIELVNGQRIRFRTRTKGGGRGFSCDCLILDEAMELAASAHQALMPTLSAMPNPQIWYTGSAVDQEIHDNGVVFTRIRDRGVADDSKRLAFFEWSAGDDPDIVDIADREAWAAANPGLGIRVDEEFVETEQESMDSKAFMVERLGVGDWPDLGRLDNQGIDFAAWQACEDQSSKRTGDVAFTVDVRPDRGAGAIAVAGRREDGLMHVETVEHEAGTGWIPQRVADLVEKHDPVSVSLAKGSPAESLVPDLQALGVDVRVLSASEHAQACGRIFDAVEQRTLRHLGSNELARAVKGAIKRPLGDAWAWSRRSSLVDISPLVAATLALWAVETAERETQFFFDVVG